MFKLQTEINLILKSFFRNLGRNVIVDYTNGVNMV